MNLYNNYVRTKHLGLNHNQIKENCISFSEFISSNFEQPKIEYSGVSTDPLTTKLFSEYNILMYPYPEFHLLYEEIRKMFREVSNTTSPNYIQCWLNCYNKGEFINWHGHWQKEFTSWHGFYCVDVEPSVTTYRIQGYEEIDIQGSNDLLIMSPSGFDVHRTWPWEDENRPRITIAFDIIPAEHINPTGITNHWIPI